MELSKVVLTLFYILYGKAEIDSDKKPRDLKVTAEPSRSAAILSAHVSKTANNVYFRRKTIL